MRIERWIARPCAIDSGAGPGTRPGSQRPNMQLTSDLRGHEKAFMDLELEASGPYSGFVYDDAAQADEVRQLLLTRRECEFAPPYGRVVLEEGHVAGLLACLSAADLIRCRLRAALVLSRTGLLERSSGLTRRIHLA